MPSAIVVLIFRMIMAIALYLFVAWAFYTIWQDLRLQSRNLASQKIPPVSIKIQNTPEEEGLSHQFSLPELIIGRDQSCDLMIQDDTISSHHSRLSYHHHQWWIEDMHSTNGTFLNQERLTTPTVMIDGDEIRCGHVLITINIMD
jgi:hypothetical protein